MRANDPPSSLSFTPDEFERLVKEAVDTLPHEYQARLKNLALVVEEEPAPQVLEELGIESQDDLLGLYTGSAEGKESFFDAGGQLPARISIYRGPILRLCRTSEEVIQEIRDTVVHEIGHHFGLDDHEMPY